MGILSDYQPKAVSNQTFQLLTLAEIYEGIQYSILTVPGSAKSATLSIEAAAGSIAGEVIARYWMDGSAPDYATNAGLPLYAGDVIEITGSACLTGLKIITQNDLKHRINVQFFNFCKALA